MSRYQPAHARPGQRRDAVSARARGTWARLLRALRPARSWYPAAYEWRALAGGVRALSAVLLDTLTPAPSTPVVQAPVPGVGSGQAMPRPADPPCGSGAVRAGAILRTPEQEAADGNYLAARVAARPGGPEALARARAAYLPAPTTPGAVTAADGTRPQDPAAPQPGAAAAPTPMGGTATLPLPEAGASPSAPPGQGQPLPSYRGDYRRTEPFRAVPAVPVNVVRPYYPALQAWRDGMAVTR